MANLTLHRGLDYACIMRPEDTTDTALVQVMHPSDDDIELLTKMAAAPEMLLALRGMLGLVQLFCARPDVSPEFKKATQENHRVLAARAAVAKAEGRS